MRRLLAITLLISSLACGCAAGLAAPAALAIGPTTTTTTPSFNLNNAANNAVTPVTTASSSGNSGSTSSSGGLSSLDGLIIAAVAVILLVAIALFVRSDARNHLAHVRHGDREDPMFATAHSGSKAHRKSRKLTPAERKRRKRGRAR